MQLTSYATAIPGSLQKISTRVILETPNSKEIQILLPAGQVMKEHQAPYPMIVHLLTGTIIFGTPGTEHHLKAGDILSLEAKVPHDLTAVTDSIVRLSLATADSASRVSAVVTEKTN